MESKDVDTISVTTRRSRQESDSMEVDGEETVLSEEEYIARLNLFVQTCLRRSAHGHEDYKTTVVNDERRRVIADFYRRAIAKKKCENCAW